MITIDVISFIAGGLIFGTVVGGLVHSWDIYNRGSK